MNGQFQNDRFEPQNNPENYFYHPAEYFFEAKRREKREIRYQSLLAGFAILSLILVQNIAVTLMALFDVYNTYLNNPLFQSGVDIIIILLSILLPFSIFGKMIQNRSGVPELLPFEKPREGKLLPLAVVGGLGMCMLANIVTGFLTSFLTAAGLELSSPDLAMPEGGLGILASFCRVVLVAAFVEEMALRGYIMQNLRKFGDGFAIAMSALVFGLMHCNLIQTPFALIVGAVLGYLCIKTGSLWTAVLVHALNNSISLAASYLDSVVEKSVLNSLESLLIYALILAGIPCFIVFVRKVNETPQRKIKTALSNGEKTAAYLTTPTMIIAIVVMLYLTSQYVKIG